MYMYRNTEEVKFVFCELLLTGNFVLVFKIYDKSNITKHLNGQI